jgi:hypothetical protein
LIRMAYELPRMNPSILKPSLEYRINGFNSSGYLSETINTDKKIMGLNFYISVVWTLAMPDKRYFVWRRYSAEKTAPIAKNGLRSSFPGLFRRFNHHLLFGCVMSTIRLLA